MKQSEKTNSKNEEKCNKHLYCIDFSTTLKLARKYFIHRNSEKSIDIIRLMTRHVHAVKQNFDNLDDPFMELAQYISDTDDIL